MLPLLRRVADMNRRWTLPIPTNLRSLERALTAEVAAEANRAEAEAAWRSAWWATTWALAAVPRAEWGQAMAHYCHRTGHHAETAKNRRRTGARLPESNPEVALPAPRMAVEAATSLGRNPRPEDVTAMLELLAEAERDGMSLREFAQALTGRSWTAAPENMTTADEDAVVRRVARERPAALAEAVEQAPEVQTVLTTRRAQRQAGYDESRREGNAEWERIERRGRLGMEQGEHQTRTRDEAALTVLRVVQTVVEARVNRGLLVADEDLDDATLRGALVALETAAASWRAALDGEVSGWTENDRTMADELGIDLGAWA